MTISGDKENDDDTSLSDQSTSYVIQDDTDHQLLLCNKTTLVDSDKHILDDVQQYKGTLFQKKNNDNNNSSKTGNVRNRWPKLTQVVTDEDGNDKNEYPFLSMNNWKDIIFVQHLAVDHPYKATFGQQCNLWEKMAKDMSTERDPSGNLVYPSNLNEKSLQARFVEYSFL
jgi:hypothetical protein